MPWFLLAHVLAAGTRQSTIPSWSLWMFSFGKCPDQSLDRRQKLIGMRLGTRLLVYGMSGSEVLFQMHTLIMRPCKNDWNLAKHVTVLLAHRWVQRLLSWHLFGTRRVGHPRHKWESEHHAYCSYANQILDRGRKRLWMTSCGTLMKVHL